MFKIVVARKGKKLSQGEVAKRVGISRVAYGRIERRQADPRVGTAARISEVLDLPIDDFYDKVEPLIEVDVVVRSRDTVGFKEAFRFKLKEVTKYSYAAFIDLLCKWNGGEWKC